MAKKTPQGRPTASAIHLLHRAGQCADELFANAMGASQLTPRQFAVLKAVSGADEPSQTTLVEATGIDRSTLADIVRRLVERGMLERQRTRRDARMYAVKLTAQGEAAVSQLTPLAASIEAELLATLPERDRAVFLRALAQLVETLGPIASARVPVRGQGVRNEEHENCV